ncbi:hypothetical protein AUR04nite_22260 [Glutamicibacter uratoxydans]|uniref:ABC3 transporter permease protein domain-containing protein n=1 Tax=Glutamicibacter uratoxydans TaxID=43667 RepID=A0A4Y4DS09_GLUUR|nr:hypothetical protein AUR04nite_22260 [Glutamicibacter uratoxydans]
MGDPGTNTFIDDIRKADTTATVGLMAPDMPVIGLVDDGLTYYEAEWGGPMGESYVLDNGRWPTRPGEVLVIGNTARTPEIGRSLQLLGKAEATIVGTGRDKAYGGTFLLAAPGTWATMHPTNDASLTGVYGKVEVLLPTLDNLDDFKKSVTEAATAANYEMTSDAEFLMTENVVINLLPRPWIDRSPILFWVPSLVIIPFAAVLTFLSQHRRIVPAISNLVRNGAASRLSLSAPLTPIALWCFLGSGSGAMAGTAAGLGIAVAGAGTFAAPMPTIAIPTSGFTALAVGMVLGIVAGAWSIALRALPRTKKSSRQANISRSNKWATYRRIALIALLGMTIYWMLSSRTSWNILQTVCLAMGILLLAAPEVPRLLGDALPQHQLSTILTRNLIKKHSGQASVFFAVIAIGIGLTAGVVTSVNSAVAAEEAKLSITAPVGQLTLDNDGAPSYQVSPEVIEAAEKVPALAQQQPVQLWSTLLVTAKNQKPKGDESYVTSANDYGVTFAVEDVEDLERLFQRPLTDIEKATFTSGGLITVNPEALTDPDSISLKDSVNSNKTYGTIPAVIAEVEPAPWFVFTAGFVSRATAEQLSLPQLKASLVYTDLAEKDSQEVLRELTHAGINPEQAGVHYEHPPVIPDAALLGISSMLIIISVSIASLATRGQIAGMRKWIHTLSQHGVPSQWISRVLVRQILVLSVTAALVGTAAGVIPMVIGSYVVPQVPFELPWLLIILTALVLCGLCAIVSWLTVRAITQSSPVSHNRV